MDERAKTELVLVIQQNSITDIITFLKTLESDVRTFRELKAWPIIETKLFTVLNIRKVNTLILIKRLKYYYPPRFEFLQHANRDTL